MISRSPAPISAASTEFAALAQLVNGEAVTSSCLMFAVQANNAEIETIEGLTHSGKIARLQDLFSKHHALQCGYCTPGMLVIAYDLLRQHETLSLDDIRDGMSAALCRCTGYKGIIKAVHEASEEQTDASVVQAKRMNKRFRRRVMSAA